jgi:lysozyme
MSGRLVSLVALSTAGLIALAGALLYQGAVRLNYPSFAEYPVQGIDVSHHQGRIDWAKLKSTRSQFAYIKASQGATFRDSLFTANWNGALAAGVVPGSYHYFSLCRSGADQATNFIAAAGWTKAFGLPPAVDLEFRGNCGRRPSAAEFSAELQKFLELVEREWGCRPVLYVTEEFYYPYVAEPFGSYQLWVRNIFAEPRLAGGRAWRIWQFANRGRLPGVETFVDLDAFNGSTQEFAAFRCAPPPLDLQPASALPSDSLATVRADDAPARGSDRAP